MQEPAQPLGWTDGNIFGASMAMLPVGASLDNSAIATSSASSD